MKPIPLTETQMAELFGLRAENAALKAQCESLRNDLLDALDCKNGQGPTALSIVMNAKDALKEQVAQQSDELNSFYNNAKAGFNRQLRDQETIAYLQSKSAALADALEWYFDPTIDSWKRDAIIRKALDELSETSHALGGY